MGNMTIKDIARISGCSVSTISRVINDRPDVRPETKERVLEVMREAGFVPNTNARQLKIQQSRSLVFVVKGTRNIFFSDFLVQLQRAATLYGYNGIVSYLDENANEIDAAEKILREIKPKGMIFLGGSVANFQKGFANISVPSVLATLVSDELDFPNLSMVGVDDRAAAYQAVSYLIQQGHRKIAVLGGPATSHPSMMRRQGAQQRLRTGPLEGELGRLIGEILQSAVPGQVGGHPIPVLADVGGVDHRQPGRVRTAVDDQIVHHASVLVAHGGIAGLAVRHAGKVVGHEPVEVGQGVGAPEEQLSHVADVEQAAAGAHGPVLGDDAGVLHRQQPSGKGNQLAPRRRVAVVERSFAFHFHALL